MKKIFSSKKTIPPPIDTKKSQPYTKSIMVQNRYKKYRFIIIG